MSDYSAVVFGDWHGNDHFACSALDAAHDRVPAGVPFVHVGDFGLFPTLLSFNISMPREDIAGVIFNEELCLKDRHQFIADLPEGMLTGPLAVIDAHLRELGRLMYVVLGNHENYWELDEALGFGGYIGANPTPASAAAPLLTWGSDAHTLAESVDSIAYLDSQGFLCSPLLTNIRLIPRTHVWEWSGTVFGSLGGACSIDKEYRSRGRSWWPEEVPTAEQVRSLDGEYVDVLVCHDGPFPAVTTLYGDGHALPPHLQSWVDISTKAVEAARKLTSPALLIHGHHHVRYTSNVNVTQVVGLSADVSGGPITDSFYLVPAGAL